MRVQQCVRYANFQIYIYRDSRLNRPESVSLARQYDLPDSEENRLWCMYANGHLQTVCKEVHLTPRRSIQLPSNLNGCI